MYKTHTGKCFTLIPNHNCTMTLFCTRFPIESKDHTHDHGSIGLYFEHSVFSSLFKWDGISPVENDFKWKSQRRNHLKMGFPLPAVIYLGENLFGPKISCPLFLLLIGNYFVFLRSFPFYFLPIFLFISPFPSLSLGIRVLAFVICSPLRKFCCLFLRGKG